MNLWEKIKFLFWFIISIFIIADSLSYISESSNAQETKLIYFKTDIKTDVKTDATVIKTKTKKKTKTNTKIIFCDETIDSSDLDFIKELIAATESQSGMFKPKDTMIYVRSWYQINKDTKAAGRYQFIKTTRKSIAKQLNETEPDFYEFLKDRKMQDRYLIAFLESNNDHFKKPIRIYKDGKVIASYPDNAYKKFRGKVINGYYISKSGMILISHALGAQGTIDWLIKGCQRDSLPVEVNLIDRRLSVNIF